MADKRVRDMRLATPTTSAAAPRVEFPCDYPLKIVGNAADDFQALVTAVVEKHAPGFDRQSIKVVDSRNGKFQSVRLTITATGKAQLEALFADLKATGRVQMVL